MRTFSLDWLHAFAYLYLNMYCKYIDFIGQLKLSGIQTKRNVDNAKRYITITIYICLLMLSNSGSVSDEKMHTYACEW